jgi:hypothetical protein
MSFYGPATIRFVKSITLPADAFSARGGGDYEEITGKEIIADTRYLYQGIDDGRLTGFKAGKNVLFIAFLRTRV